MGTRMFEDTKVGDTLVVRTSGFKEHAYETVKVTRITKASVFTVLKDGAAEVRWFRSNGRQYGGTHDRWHPRMLSDNPRDLTRARRYRKMDRLSRLCNYISSRAGGLTDEDLDAVLRQLSAIRDQFFMDKK